MAALANLRYSARSFMRTPGLTLALLLTIACGIGSTAAVHGFVRGLIARESPLPAAHAHMADGLSRVGGLLGIAAGAVFFIACANVASLLLGRAFARSHETSIRVALGASRGQLARQLLSDSVLISVAGGAVGMLLAFWTTQIVPALFFEQDAEQLAFAPDFVAIVSASAACGAITIACGLVPLLEVRHDRPAAVLGRDSTGPSPAMRRLRAGLVVAQMASCCALVIASGRLLQDFRSALQTTAGHRLRHSIVATVHARATMSRHETREIGLKYFRDIEHTARSAADVSIRAWVGRLPGAFPTWLSLRIEPSTLPRRDIGPGRFRAPARGGLARLALDATVVSPEYFDAMGFTLIAGALFQQDPAPRGRVAVINQQAADLYFDGNAVGAAVIDDAGSRTEIVGVVHSPPLRTFQRPVEPAIYFPLTQDFVPRMSLLLDAREPGDATLETLRRRLELVPGRGPFPVVVTTLEAHLSRTALAPLRIATILVSAFAATALALGVLGLHGALADAARQRRREIAVRLALGAQAWRMVRHVAGEGGRLAAAGAAAGMLGSLLVERLLARITPSAGSPAWWVWLTAPVVLLAAVIVASVVPAWRAIGVDPLTIARNDA